MEEDVKIHGSILLAGLNAFLVILIYFFCAMATLFYLETFHNIDLFNIMISSIPLLLSVPWFVDFMLLTQIIIEHILLAAFLSASLYAISLSNNRLEINDGDFIWKKGMFFIKKKEFHVDDIEQVFTEDYLFFRKTKKLCIKSLNNEIIRIDFVKDADSIKENILKDVKNHRESAEIHDLVETPVKVT